MSLVQVTHALGEYPVRVEPGALADLRREAGERLPNRRLAMIADDTVLALLEQRKLGGARWDAEVFSFAAGEGSKTRDQWARLTDLLLERNFGRDSGLVTLGGGVAGDLGGFVAATYMRGLPYLQAPTTLLAMVDASVGGKTGVDTPQGKNLIGAFHPPVAVLADPQVLGTLPEREFRGGLAETVKHGLIADREYFEWIERSAPALLRRDAETLTRLVRRSVEIKADVVSGDERETGRRAILNAGHTVAHAIERATGYAIPHGEAVALGLVAECELAERLGLAPAGLRERVGALLTVLGLPVRLRQPVDFSTLEAAMSSDKKNRATRVRFALPRTVGAMQEADGWTVEAPPEAVISALETIV